MMPLMGRQPDALAVAVPAQDDRRIVCAGWAKNVVAVQTVRALRNIPIGMDAGRQWLYGPGHDTAGMVVSGLKGMSVWQSGPCSSASRGSSVVNMKA